MSFLNGLNQSVETVKAAKASVSRGDTPFVAILRDSSGELHVGNAPQDSLEGNAAHAERDVIRKAKAASGGTLPKDSVLYTLARPCPSCVSHAIREGVVQIVFVVGGDDLSEFGLPSYPAHTPKELLQVPSHPSLGIYEVLKTWKDSKQ